MLIPVNCKWHVPRWLFNYSLFAFVSVTFCFSNESKQTCLISSHWEHSTSALRPPLSPHKPQLSEAFLHLPQTVPLWPSSGLEQSQRGSSLPGGVQGALWKEESSEPLSDLPLRNSEIFQESFEAAWIPVWLSHGSKIFMEASSCRVMGKAWPNPWVGPSASTQ